MLVIEVSPRPYVLTARSVNYSDRQMIGGNVRKVVRPKGHAHDYRREAAKARPSAQDAAARIIRRYFIVCAG